MDARCNQVTSPKIAALLILATPGFSLVAAEIVVAKKLRLHLLSIPQKGKPTAVIDGLDQDLIAGLSHCLFGMVCAAP